MRKNICEVVRQEFDELMLGESSSTSAVDHLKECSACREFNETQTKLRQMVGSLGTVAAPADFDFRLRARLANDAGSEAFHFRPLMRKGFAVAAAVIVFTLGAFAIVRNVVNQPEKTVAEKKPPVQSESPVQVQTPAQNTPAAPEQLTANATSGNRDIRNERPPSTALRIKPLQTRDSAKVRAEVLPLSEAFSSDAVFSIDASLQPLRLSLDDVNGNAKTISVPTIRFGSQRMLPNKNQYSEKGIW